MNRSYLGLAAVLSLFACTPASAPHAGLSDAAAIEAAEHAPLGAFAVNGKWNEPFAPFTVLGNIHYVGTQGVSAFLITTPRGHILIDGILPQTAPQIIANIAKLGFDIRDVKYLLNSHAHIDHAGGLAALQRASGARMIASAADKPILERGDVGFGPTAGMRFPPVRVDRTIGDGETVAVGGAVLTAHLTPGHTPGCTTWTMQVAGADRRPLRVLFHCSMTVAGQSLVPESYPGMVADYRRSFAKMRGLSADVFLANHNNFFDLEAKRARQIADDANAFVNPAELRAFNDELESAFNQELSRQQAAARNAKAQQ